MENSPPFKDGYFTPSTKVYCEDDYFVESLSEQYHLKCDRTIQQVPETQLPFNYSRFNEYLKIKNEIGRYNRLVEASKGINFTTSGLEYFTDEKLKEELFEVYGDLDEGSERFKLLFRNYKEQRFEQVKEWIHNETEFRNKKDEMQCLNEETTILEHFTEEEITSFKAVANGKKFDPFMLSRKKKQGTSLAIDKAKAKYTKTKSHLNQRNDIIVGEVKAILQNHPHGLALNKLTHLCNERLEKKNVFMSFNSEIISHLTKERILFTQNVFQDELDVVVPFSSSSKQNFRDILWNLKHRLLVILNLSFGIVEINESLELCTKIFKTDCEGVPYPLPYIDWGFKTGMHFVQWLLLEKWRLSEVEIIQLNVDGLGNKYYLAKMTRESSKLLDRRKRTDDLKLASTSTAVPESVPWSSPLNRINATQQQQQPLILVDPKYVQPCEKINQEQNDIKPGDQFDCVVSLVNSPTNFYLVKLLKWKQLDRLFNELRDYWSSLSVVPSSDPSLAPHPQFLQRNYICLCKTDEDEIYRVVILGKPDLHHYQVYCIDYGDLFRVHYDQLRYLPKDLFYTLDAQAISCSLYNVACPPNTNDCWSNAICDYTRKLFSPADDDLPVIKVNFKQRLNGNGKWLVMASAPQRNKKDFGENVMKFVNK